MRAKNIKSVLRRKFKKFLRSIDDSAVRELVSNNTIITGGSIASMLLGEEVHDYDVYFRNEKTASAVADYYVEKFSQQHPEKASKLKLRVDCSNGRVKVVVQSSGIVTESMNEDSYQYFENGDTEGVGSGEFLNEATEAAESASNNEQEFRPVWMSANAITLSDKVQVVLRFFGEPEEIHKNYDFVHCTNYWTSWNGKLKLKPEALECLLAKELRYVGSKYPICSVIRTRKFINRGWTINAGQYLKMCFQISDLNLRDVDILEDQLTGVDAAYFAEVITLLREEMEKRNSKKIEDTYLMSLIDKIF